VEKGVSDVFPMATELNRSPTRSRLITHGIACGLFLVVLAVGVPRVEATYSDYNVPLPRLSILVFAAAHVVSWGSPPIVVVPVLFLILLSADWLMLKALVARSGSELTGAWSMFMLGAPLLLIALTLFALIQPLLTIMPRLSG
jgi:hypothetical protein